MDIVVHNAEENTSELYTFQVHQGSNNIKSGQYYFGDRAGLARKSSLEHDPRDRKTESGRILLENTNDTTNDDELFSK